MAAWRGRRGGASITGARPPAGHINSRGRAFEGAVGEGPVPR